VRVPSRAERVSSADALAAAHGWVGLDIPAGVFKVRAYLPRQPVHRNRLTIYIEGDGFAWFSRSEASRDPTPINPLGLKLALAQPSGESAYLARPCQYLGAGKGACRVSEWTLRRFGPELVAAENRAVDALKRRFKAVHLTLVGYSGGAAMAVLLAARRHDVDRLVSVAGNLDPQAWTSYHKVSPLRGSLDPMKVTASLKGVRQWCFVGARDRDIPPFLARSYARRFPSRQRPRVIVVDELDHHKGWARRWPALWRRYLSTMPAATSR